VFGVSSILKESGNWHPVSASYLGYKLPQRPLGSQPRSFRITDQLEVDREAAGQYQETPLRPVSRFHLDAYAEIGPYQLGLNHRRDKSLYVAFS
jgi:hypothetical protein